MLLSSATASHRNIFIKCLLCIPYESCSGVCGESENTFCYIGWSFRHDRLGTKMQAKGTAAASLGASVVILVLFLTHRSTNMDMWHCFENQASFLELRLMLHNPRTAPRPSKSWCFSQSFKLCWGVWMSSLISLRAALAVVVVMREGLVKLWD